jgi:DNA-binding transcriptional LysR family regulator
VSQGVPRGVLAITAPVAFGRIHVRSLVAAFLENNAEVQVRMLLLDRVVSLIDEGIDVAIRIGHMPDSSLIAVRVGDVRRVVCASREYLARARRPREPADLAGHACISFSQTTPTDTWTFAGGAEGGRARAVRVFSRITVNNADAAIALAVDGAGITSVLSYQVERELRDGALVRILGPFEPEPLPVYVVHPAASASSAKVRAFTAMAIPGLRRVLGKANPALR